MTPCSSCIHYEERVMSLSRFPHGSAQRMGQMSEGRCDWNRLWREGGGGVIDWICLLLFASTLFILFVFVCKPQIHKTTKWEAALLLLPYATPQTFNRFLSHLSIEGSKHGVLSWESWQHVLCCRSLRKYKNIYCLESLFFFFNSSFVAGRFCFSCNHVKSDAWKPLRLANH